MWTIMAFAGERVSLRPSDAAQDEVERLSPGRAVAVWVVAALIGWAVTVGAVWAATSVAGA